MVGVDGNSRLKVELPQRREGYPINFYLGRVYFFLFFLFPALVNCTEGQGVYMGNLGTVSMHVVFFRSSVWVLCKNGLDL